MKKKLMKLYQKMLDRFGPQEWWPGDTPWEICAGAVLTQNTNWGNVEKAIANLKELNALCPRRICEMPSPELAEAIRPSGYFNLKAVRLRCVAEWWLQNVKNDKLAQKKNLQYWRHSILEVKGVGPETADSILLYSFDLPTFVIDTYTKRIMARHFGTEPEIDYHELQALFMNNLPDDPELFNEFHALFVRTAKETCIKKECKSDCPLK
jgi:endonuclease-3 related protein